MRRFQLRLPNHQLQLPVKSLGYTVLFIYSLYFNGRGGSEGQLGKSVGCQHGLWNWDALDIEEWLGFDGVYGQGSRLHLPSNCPSPHLLHPLSLGDTCSVEEVIAAVVQLKLLKLILNNNVSQVCSQDFHKGVTSCNLHGCQKYMFVCIIMYFFTCPEIASEAILEYVAVNKLT